MSIAEDFPIGYVSVDTYAAWQELAIARGYDCHESPDEFYVVATNDLAEVGGEYDGEAGTGWVS